MNLKYLPGVKIKRKDHVEPVLSKLEMDKHASHFLQEIGESVGYCICSPRDTPLELIIDMLGFNLEFVTFADSHILGATIFDGGSYPVIRDNKKCRDVFNERSILISSTLSDNENQNGRFLYTLAHEFGHCFYHQDYFSKKSKNLSFDFEKELLNSGFVSCADVGNGNHDLYWEREDWIEWQAEYFASCLLMPRESVFVFMDSNLCNGNDFKLESCNNYPIDNLNYAKRKEIITKFVETYKVSKLAAAIRMKELKLISSKEVAMIL